MRKAKKRKKSTLFRPPFCQFSTFFNSDWRFGILVTRSSWMCSTMAFKEYLGDVFLRFVKNRQFLGRHFVNFQHFSIPIEDLESWYLDLAGCKAPRHSKNIQGTRFWDFCNFDQFSLDYAKFCEKFQNFISCVFLYSYCGHL